LITKGQQKNNARVHNQAIKGAQNSLLGLDTNYGQADIDSSWGGYQKGLQSLDPAKMFGEMEQNPFYQALYSLRAKPINDEFDAGMQDTTSGFSARGLTDSSAAAYQMHLLRKQKQDALSKVQLESQLGTQEQAYNYANLLRQLFADSTARRNDYFSSRLSNANNLVGIANNALQPQLANNARGSATKKTWLGDAVDGFTDIASAISGFNPARRIAGAMKPQASGGVF
jgi:hypothetical protein